MNKLLTGIAGATLSTLAFAGGGPEVIINEVYASHAGTDDQEFIELYAGPNASLDGIVVCVVEGDFGSNGTMDRAWDLTGMTAQADGYFVLGNTAVGTSFPGELDLDIGASNILENGTQTYYVISTGDPSAITALTGTDVTTGDKTTVLPTLGTVIDIIAQNDDDSEDRTYDGATLVGPEEGGSNFLPAGFIRESNNAAALFCYQDFLDFDDEVNLSLPRTPGSANTPCGPVSYQNLGCGLFASGDNTSPNLFGTGTLTPGASGSLEIQNSGQDPKTGTSPGFLVVGATTLSAPFKGGVMVPTPDIAVAITTTFGGASLPFTFPTFLSAGDAFIAQAWLMNVGGPAGWEASNALRIIAQ